MPLGIVSPQKDEPRAGVAIGDLIVDLPALHATGLLRGEAGDAAAAARGPTRNELLALGDGPRRALRRRLSELLSDDSFRAAVELAPSGIWLRELLSDVRRGVNADVEISVIANCIWQLYNSGRSHLPPDAASSNSLVHPASVPAGCTEDARP